MLEISTNKKKLNIEMIHAFLTEAYWAKGRTIEEVKKSVDHCLCFGIYVDNLQIGFARVLTDYTVFAYLMDVFILPKHRGKGHSKELLKAIFSNEELKTCKWMLKTEDAQGLYSQFGFEVVSQTERTMEKS